MSGLPSCPICLLDGAALRYSLPDMRVYSCRSCGTQLLVKETGSQPSSSFTDEVSYYKPDIAAPFDERNNCELTLTGASVSRVTASASFFRLICSILGREPLSLLDLGCGNGALVHVATASGVRAVGIDTSARSIEMAGAKPGDFRCVDLRYFDSGADAYDAVTMLDTIEHFEDPAAILRPSYAAVAAGGALILTTPNADSWLSRQQGESYWHYSADHEVLFTGEALETLLSRCGIFDFRVTDLGQFLGKIATDEDWFAVTKYTKYRSHLLAIARRSNRTCRGIS